MAALAPGRIDLPRRVPILMYHSIGAPGERAGRYRVPVESFAAQMELLRRRGYRPCTLDDLLKGAPGEKPVVISFDDGYRDNLEQAGPVLMRHGFPATLFVVAEAVGEKNGWTDCPELKGRGLAGWEELREAAARGISIGSHSATHRRMPALGADEVLREAQGSRRIIEKGVGGPVRHFSYPFGALDPAVRDLVAAAGFASACGTEPGFNGTGVDPFCLRRIEIRGEDSLFCFSTKLALGTNDGSLASLAGYYVRRLLR